MYIFVLLFAVCIGCSILAIFLLKRKQNKKEQYQVELKTRNNNLDNQLKNPLIDEKRGSYHPYYEKFAEGTEEENRRYIPSFQLIERTNRAVREYMFQKNELVYIGKKEGILTVFKTEFEGESYCRIYSKQNLYCIKVVGQAEVRIKRGKQETLVGPKGIVLKNRDVICLPGIEYIFQIIHS